MWRQEISALQNLLEKKNDKFIMNNSDRSLGAASAEKKDVMKEWKRQLHDINTCIRLSMQGAEILIT